MKRAKRLTAILLAVLMAALVLSACKKQAAPPVAPPADTGTDADTDTASVTDEAPAKAKKIVFTVTHQSNDLTVQVGEQFRKIGAERGYEVSLVSAELDASVQIQQIETAVVNGADAIVIWAVAADALTAGVTAAADAKVPLFTIMSGVTQSDQVVSHITTDMPAGAKLKTEQLIKDIGGAGNICRMYGVMGAQTQIDITAGEDAALATAPDVKVVFDGIGSWKAENAIKLAENWVTADGSIKAINCNNDGMALGVVTMLDSAGLTGKILVYGHDGIKDALTAISEGRMAATAYVDREALIAALFDAIDAHFAGQTVAPEYRIPEVLITSENAAEYMGR